MVDDRNPRDRETYVTRESHVERDTGRSGSTMAFVLGGLVVAVLAIAYFLFGAGDGGVTNGGTGTNVTVEAPDGGEIVEDGGDASVTGGGTETNVTVEAPDVVEDSGDGGVTDGGTETNVTVETPDVVEDGGQNSGSIQDGGNAIDNGGDAADDATVEEAN